MMTFDEAKYALAKLISDEKYKDLSAAEKQQAILDLAKDVNADMAGSKTVLYSGSVKVNDETAMKAWDIAKEMAKDPNVRIIDKTDVGKFLDSVEFKNAIYATVVDDYKAYLTGDLSPEAMEIAKSKIETFDNEKIYHATDGVWAEASQRFASSAKGEVILIVGEERGLNSVFSQTEFPELVKNSDITKIKNIEKDKFLNLTSIKSATI
ncbi:MAG: hypothetical protein LBG67_04775 [Campylobacteraceae bacterium]|nr:hypothetical protein [Campylobacteraceae bacterium]